MTSLPVFRQMFGYPSLLGRDGLPTISLPIAFPVSQIRPNLPKIVSSNADFSKFEQECAEPFCVVMTHHTAKANLEKGSSWPPELRDRKQQDIEIPHALKKSTLPGSQQIYLTKKRHSPEMINKGGGGYHLDRPGLKGLLERSAAQSKKMSRVISTRAALEASRRATSRYRVDSIPSLRQRSGKQSVWRKNPCLQRHL